jgi:hypothetical protein
MKTSTTHKVIYWVATGLIFLFEGVMSALTSHTHMAIDGIRHLGYPDYFRVLLTVFKVIGALALIIPAVKGRYKEWAYAGFGITIISASVSHVVVDGPTGQSFFPLIIFAILVTSYVFYNKINGDIERAALNSQ